MKILLVRLSSFGDVVFTLPLAHALRSSFPGATLAWAVEAPLAPLLEGSPDVDLVLTATTRAWRRAPLSREIRLDASRFVREARAYDPDLVVDAQGLFKSAWIPLLLPAARRVGFGPRSATERVACLATDEWVRAPRGAHVVDRGLALARHLARPIPGRDGFSRVPDVSHLVSRPDGPVDEWLRARGGAPFVLLQPFASARGKEWRNPPVLDFAARLAAAGAPPAVLRWGPGEEERARGLATGSEGLLTLAPPAGPAASARLAAAAALFVGADTGPTHLAAAAGTPTIALYGPTDPVRFGPVGPRARTAPLPAEPYNPPTGLGRAPDDEPDPLSRAALDLLGLPPR